MNQILNILTFLKEVVFGRVKSRQLSKASMIRISLFLAAFALSLYSNYVLMKATYVLSAKNIALAEKSRTNEEIVTEAMALRKQVIFYESLLDKLGGEIPKDVLLQATLPPVVPRTPVKKNEDISLVIKNIK